MKEKVINFKSKTDLENSVNEAEARFHEQICDVAEALVGDNTRILSPCRTELLRQDDRFASPLPRA